MGPRYHGVAWQRALALWPTVLLTLTLAACAARSASGLSRSKKAQETQPLLAALSALWPTDCTNQHNASFSRQQCTKSRRVWLRMAAFFEREWTRYAHLELNATMSEEDASVYLGTQEIDVNDNLLAYMLHLAPLHGLPAWSGATNADAVLRDDVRQWLAERGLSRVSRITSLTSGRVGAAKIPKSKEKPLVIGTLLSDLLRRPAAYFSFLDATAKEFEAAFATGSFSSTSPQTSDNTPFRFRVNGLAPSLLIPGFTGWFKLSSQTSNGDEWCENVLVRLPAKTAATSTITFNGKAAQVVHLSICANSRSVRISSSHSLRVSAIAGDEANDSTYGLTPHEWYSATRNEVAMHIEEPAYESLFGALGSYSDTLSEVVVSDLDNDRQRRSVLYLWDSSTLAAAISTAATRPHVSETDALRIESDLDRAMTWPRLKTVQGDFGLGPIYFNRIRETRGRVRTLPPSQATRMPAAS